MTNRLPDVDIIVPFYKSSLEAINCFILTIEAQKYQKNKIHLMLVDNNKQPAKNKFMRTDIDVTIFDCSEVGAYAARNYAVHHSNHEILIFSDIDCLPQPMWISELVNAISTLTDSKTIVAGAIKVTSKNEKFSLLEDFDRRTHLRQEKYVLNGYAATANLATRRDFFNIVGDFSSYLLSGGDEAWCKNAINNHGGNLVYVDSAVVKHPARSSLKSIIKKNRRGCGGNFRRLQKIGGFPGLKGIVNEFQAIPERWNRLWEKQIETPYSRRLLLGIIFFIVEVIRFFELLRLGLGFKPERE